MRIFPSFLIKIQVPSIFLLLAIGHFMTGCGEESTGSQVDPNAQIILLAPKGGETYKIGDNLRIEWKLQGQGEAEINSATVQLSPDSGVTWLFLKNGSISVDDEEWGEFSWTIPEEWTAKGETYRFAGAKNIMVRVQDYQNTTDPEKRATTDRPISIAP